MLITRVFGSERKAAIKELNKMRSAMIKHDPGKGKGALKEEVHRIISASARYVDQALRQRLKEIETLITNPGEERVAIERDLGALEKCLDDLSGIEITLQRVRTSAREIDI